MTKKLFPPQMTHVNMNLLCAIELLTTGIDPNVHDICEVALIPLNNRIQIADEVPPLCIQMVPWNVEPGKKYRLKRDTLLQYAQNGVPPTTGASIFEAWFDDLPFTRRNHKIMPLAYNWPMKRLFIEKWLGHHHCRKFFHLQYRDILSTGIYLNDRDTFRNEFPKHPKVTLAYLGNCREVEVDERTDPMEKCLAIAEIYKRMVGMR